MDDLTQKRGKQIKDLWQKSKERMAEDLALRHNLLYLNLKQVNISPSALEIVPEERAKKANLAVFEKIGNLLKAAVLDPENPETIRITEELKGRAYKIIIYVVTEESLNWAFNSYRFVQTRLKKIENFIDVSSTNPIEFSDLNQELLKHPPEEVTILVSLIFKSAINIDASDIHLEPQEDTALIRFRVDGMLYEVAELEQKKYRTILSRLKLLSGLKLNITNTPQNGRFSVQDKNNFFDVRISSLPGPAGEFLALRLLNPIRVAFGMTDLGIRDKDLKTLQNVISSPNGLILLTGPTGSGKTTTLYALLKAKISPGIKIIAIEDPIEYKIAGVNQTQVSKNYNFDDGLKSILRQDPDAIMIGEMRDKETVKTAIQASLTGHLVFSTLHANEAAATIDRLVELEAERSLLPGSLLVVIAQRLIRRLCPHCKEQYEPDQQMKEKIIEAFSILSPKSNLKIPQSPPFLYRAKGCEHCHWLGYTGQIGIFETLPITPRISREIIRASGRDAIRKTAIDEGVVPLFHDGLLKAIMGITSLEEIFRVAGDIDYVEKNYQDLFSQTLLRGLKITSNEEKQIDPLLFKKQSWPEFLKDKSVLKQINYLLLAAIKSRATDLHFEPEETKIKVRQRIDGVLYEITAFDLIEAPGLINEIKSLSGLKTEETQKIQEGRFKVALEEKSHDIRVSILPSGYGESASLRILGEELQALALDKIGLLPSAQKIIEKSLQNTIGLILASGPTSSGKTTTLFALLKKLNHPGVKIITIEDPIEYRLEGINQTQINEEEGYTFANALRSLLRQNPNIFLVGEIRDKETAEMAWQASLTGHLVLSTIHANNSIETIARLKSLGISPTDIIRAIQAIVAQRLIRVLCPHCKKEMPAPQEMTPYANQALSFYPEYRKQFKPPFKIFKAAGCSQCNFTGYLGQTGIFEIIEPAQIKNLEKAKFPKLIDDALIKALLGITSWSEIQRVLGV